MAPALTATGVAEIEAELAELRGELEHLLTSMMTHVAWVPEEWEQAARETLAGLEERHPSRTILLFPRPEADRSELEAEVSVKCFPLRELERHVCTEVIELRLLGARARGPASVVEPLVLPGLPVFLRWRGEPSFGDDAFEQLVDFVDRLVVDSREWRDVRSGLARLDAYCERVAVSDIAWARTLRWRRAIASLWPVEPRELHIVGPLPDSLLLAGWLRSRLGREVVLRHEPAERIELLELDGAAVRAREERPTASDLLSRQLDQFSHDRVYEAAVRAISGRRP